MAAHIYIYILRREKGNRILINSVVMAYTRHESDHVCAYYYSTRPATTVCASINMVMGYVYMNEKKKKRVYHPVAAAWHQLVFWPKEEYCVWINSPRVL